MFKRLAVKFVVTLAETAGLTVVPNKLVKRWYRESAEHQQLARERSDAYSSGVHAGQAEVLIKLIRTTRSWTERPNLDAERLWSAGSDAR